MDESWREPTAAWWAKAARARKHIQDIRTMVAEFDRSGPYEIRAEATDHPGEVAYRFHVLKPLPAELLTTVGDALHNMRSCLDSVAYELARRYLHDDMSKEQKEATQFPICRDLKAFEEFFDRGHRGIRREMYGEQERAALRCVQPFAMREDALAFGVDMKTTAEYEFITDELYRLHTLSIVDKHRYLPLLAWYLDFLYWESGDYRWRYAQPPHTELNDQALIGYLASASDDPPAASVTFDVKLSLSDDPAFRHNLVVRGDLLGVLERWHGYLVGWVLPRIFIVADGNPPPILIGG
jgi:hypothetical protein